jgi:RNA polymerase sigma-70 factor (ECF subfamily)
MDTARFERLLAPHHEAALGFARCLSRSRADGDDLFQASVIRAFHHLDGLRDETAFKPWLYRIIVTSHRNLTRRSFWRRLVPLDDHDASGEAFGDTLDGAQRAQRALGGIPPEQREAIVLFEVEGWTIDEIAAIQATSASAVKSRLSRGRERLREIYTRRLGVSAPAALPAPRGTR